MDTPRPFRPEELRDEEALANALYVTVVDPDLTWWDDLTLEAQDAWVRAARRVLATMQALVAATEAMVGE